MNEQGTYVTCIKLQKQLHHRLKQQIINDGYGMRGKSKWIVESIELLLKLSDYPSLVDLADDMEQLSDMLSIRMPETLVLRIDNAVIQIRRQYPTIEGVKSNLIRASIIQRLLRESLRLP